MPDREIVSPDEILKSEGADKPVKQGTFLQRTGLVLAAGVGILAACVIAVVIWKIFASVPPAPIIPAGADPANVKMILENYKTLQQVKLEPYTTLLDSIVVKMLLPIFTSILGYIFGTRSKEE